MENSWAMYGLEYGLHARLLSRVEVEELRFCSSDFGSGVDAADATTIFAIISTVAARRELETGIRAWWNLKRSVARVGVEERRHDNVARSYSNPNKSKRPPPPPRLPSPTPHTPFRTPVPEEACTTPLSEISINL